MFLIAIVCLAVFAVCVLLLLPKRCDACGLPINRGRCGYPDCD